MKAQIVALRTIHGGVAAYFVLCLGYIYYAAISGHFDAWFVVAFVSLGIEGFVVFVVNHGDCPLIHVQRRIGDDKPFFELLLPPRLAKRAIPIFAVITWVGVGLVALRWLLPLI